MVASLLLWALLWSAATAWGQTDQTPPGPCENGYVAPTPTDVPVTGVPIEVTSTTADYFVLYAKHTLNGKTTDVPVSVTRGEDGTTTLSDNLEPLAASQYRVEKYQVAQPADVDGDCVDDITELDDLGAYNPVNSAKKIDPVHGTVAIDSHAAFQKLARQGISHETHLNGLAFVKFWVLEAYTDSPKVFFMNTKTESYHTPFLKSIGYTGKVAGSAADGQLVWHPNVPAPDGTLGSYRFEWGALAALSFAQTERVYMTLAASMPVLEDNLYFYPETTPWNDAYKREKEKFDASRIHMLWERDVLPDIDYIALNEAEGYGRLRLVEAGERPGLLDVAIFESLPNDLPRVAGTITTVPQTPLSHVNLRAIQNKLPNAFIRDALEDDTIKPLIGKYVYYAVTARGYTIREATKTEVDAHHAKLRPSNTQTLTRDLTVKTITSLSDVEFADWNAFGVKAANMAELSKLSLPEGTVPTGYAVPFYFYDEFMKANKLYADVDKMLADPNFQSSYDEQEKQLKALRKKIKKGTTPDWIIKALEGMHGNYPNGQSLRYRSSTNNEDLPSFNGAGLYDSKTQDPDETTEDGIDKSIKGVWASLWNFRAFVERDFHRVDHKSVAMGVLVHPNYRDELVNGVAVSYDPITFLDNTYYINSQVGEDLVTNPEAYSQPEQLLLDSSGAATVLTRSNLATSNSLLMSDAQMAQLRNNLKTIHDRFATLYKVKDGEDFAIEIEYKITSANKLAIKQARPWIFPEPLDLTPTVTVAFSSAQLEEGDGLDLVVTRDGGVQSLPLKVHLVWSDPGNALKGSAPTSVTIPAKKTQKTVRVTTRTNTKDDPNHDVTVTLGANDAYTNGTPASATATVSDDHLPTIAVSAAATQVTEGDPAVFTVTANPAPAADLPVKVKVSAKGEYGVATGSRTVTISAAGTAQLSLRCVDDHTEKCQQTHPWLTLGRARGITQTTHRTRMERNEHPPH